MAERARMVRWDLSNQLESAIGCKPVSVWGGAGMHQVHFTQYSALTQPNGIPVSKFKHGPGPQPGQMTLRSSKPFTHL